MRIKKNVTEKNLELGRQLTIKKQTLKHGEFLPYLNSIGINKMKASRVMRQYEQYQKVEALKQIALQDDVEYQYNNLWTTTKKKLETVSIFDVATKVTDMFDKDGNFKL